MSPDLVLSSSPSHITSEQVCDAIETILTSQQLCSIATTDTSGNPHVNACFYSYTNDLRLFIFTSPTAQHSLNIAARPTCAVNIFSSTQMMGNNLSGVQLFCRARELNITEGASAFQNYSSRHPVLLGWATSWQTVLQKFRSRFYELEVLSGKMLHEGIFGKEEYVSFAIKRA